MPVTTALRKPQPYAGSPPFAVRRFSLDEYHQMLANGVLTEDDRVELLRGWIVPKMGHNPPHSVSLTLVQEALKDILPRGWFLRVQLPVAGCGDNEPEPDIAVVRGKPRDYKRHHPTAKDVGLLVEIADSSLEEDRTYKGSIYAEAKYQEYWIVNLVDGLVETYTDPTGSQSEPHYGTQTDYRSRREVPLVLNGVEIARIPVRDLLP
jgi:Uma2 family endonuclease